eukprot:TRINITY_DN60859_c0_g1_i1.p1 TRINITY_DN60859_c0_g1~~TRINITY_DN60859_c0_g1_i1.p1  ORF type:complete len:1181 (-),score=210.22 TRINITY_DN60859_c0_g1_i1:27-3569(-)
MQSAATVLLLCALCAGATRLEGLLEEAPDSLGNELPSTNLGDWGTPDLGDWKKRYKVTEFLARGGQATVFLGLDRDSGEAVVMRFQRYLCLENFCRVWELDKETIEEMRSNCALSNSAAERWELRMEMSRRDTTVKKQLQQPFARCLQTVSSNPGDPAFDVWSIAGRSTLAEAFFLDAEQGMLNLEQKRQVLSELKEQLAVLGDPSLQKEPCCCHQASPDVCTIQGEQRTYDWLLGKPCPSGSFLNPTACGPLVHHDVKFDNVVVQRDVSGQMHPGLIDFGSSARCNQQRAVSYSEEWAPYWLNDPLTIPGLCWSYDYFGLGLMWLVTELLQELPAAHLLCKAARQAGILEEDELVYTSEHTKEIVESCPKFKVPKQLIKTALEPVSLLISEIRFKLLLDENMSSKEAFVNALSKFIEQKESLTEEVRSLPFTMPSDDLLRGHLWSLLGGCPSLSTGSEGSGSEDRLVLQCRADRASRYLHESVANGNSEQLAPLFQEWREVCSHLQHIAGRPLWERCDDEAILLSMMVHKRDLQGLRTSFDTLKGQSSNETKTLQKRHANTLMPEGDSILALACRIGDLQIIKLLLHKGADPLLYDLQLAFPKGMALQALPLPALMAAVSRPGNIAVLNLLLRSLSERHGAKALSMVANLRIDGMKGKPSLLSQVAEKGDVEMLRAICGFLQSPKSTYSLDPKVLHLALHGSTPTFVPLLRAAAAGHAEACTVLIEAGADRNTLDDQNRSALVLAVQSGSVETVRALASARKFVPERAFEEEQGSELLPTNLIKSQVNRLVPKSGAPLHIAASGGNVEMVEELLQMGANEMQQDSHGQTPLHIAVACRSRTRAHLAVLRRLAKNTSAQLRRSIDFETPLHYLSRQCDPTVLKELLLFTSVQALKLKSEDRRGLTPLELAAVVGNVKCLQLLLQKLKEVVPMDAFNSTILRVFAMATMRGQGNVMKLLRYKFHVDKWHHMAVVVGRSDVESLLGRRDTLRLLRELFGQGVLQEQDSCGLDVLGRWAYEGDSKMVAFLVHESPRGLGVNCSATYQSNKDDAKKQHRCMNDVLRGIGSVDGLNALALVDKRIQMLQSLLHEDGKRQITFAMARGATRRDFRLEHHRNLLSYKGKWHRVSNLETLIDDLKNVKRFLQRHGCMPEKEQEKDLDESAVTLKLPTAATLYSIMHKL